MTTITAFGLASPGGAKEACHTHPATGNILIHLIFSTQGHRPLIKPDLRDDLFAYIGGIIREMPGTALIINGTSEMAHPTTSTCSYAFAPLNPQPKLLAW